MVIELLEEGNILIMKIQFYISQVTKFVISVDHLKLLLLLCSGRISITDRMHVWCAHSVEMWHLL